MRHPPLLRSLLLAALLCGAGAAATGEVPEAPPDMSAWDGERIVREVVTRHELYPYTFERQTMILMDRSGNRDVRRLRRFSRLEADGTMRYLLAFDYPPEVRGVALLATRHPDGTIENGTYLPAFGTEFKQNTGETRSAPFLGSDFTVQDLAPEVMSDFRYQREEDIRIDDLPHFVVAAYPRDAAVERGTGYGLRRLFIRQDNLFIIRIDYHDRRGRPFKRATLHDLKPVDGPMWRADMILMEELREHHLSLLKTAKRVFSRDYVPEEIFSREWILADRHVEADDQAMRPSGEGGALAMPGEDDAVAEESAQVTNPAAP